MKGMRQMTDVIIVGAGPAGTAAAFALLSKGFDVLLIDRHRFPWKKPCAGGITPKAFRLFPYDIRTLVRRECRSVKIISGSGKPLVIRTEDPLCYMVKRQELDLFSLNRVIEMGADFRVIRKIENICQTGSGVKICTDSGRFSAGYLIGADGANSVVRKYVSRDFVFQKKFAIEADVRLDKSGLYTMEFDFARVRHGYFWVFPRDDHVNIGIYCFDDRCRIRTAALYEYALKKFGTDRLESVRGYPICTGGHRFSSGSGRILLAGDAAGLAEPVLGEGIYFALKSAISAARAVIESEHGSPGSCAERIYFKSLNQIRMDLRVCSMASKIFYRFPGFWIEMLRLFPVHEKFARGYSKGMSITSIMRGRGF